ncbi:MAG: SAM-dependent chlorinase/fluorinase, partial [Myxococcales bacterium]|nr:SAM-dependent chlorinase/fluorinase [Myxococcales bacterium]
GLRADAVAPDKGIDVSGRRIRHARVFSEVAQGEPCWYRNSMGLVEIAVNCGRAADELGLAAGHPIHLID